MLDLDLLDAQAGDIALLAKSSTAKILVLTRNDDQALADKAVLDGARGVLKRSATPANFIEAIVKVNAGQIWLDRAATGRIMVELSRRHNGHVEEKKPSRLATLTDREKSIVSSILENSGDPAKTLAGKLHISESTLRNHLTSIYSKLDISNRFELISFAHKNDVHRTVFSATG
ncbi:MAG: response regulator transcription factor [Pseudomonadota bacterium]